MKKITVLFVSMLVFLIISLSCDRENSKGIFDLSARTGSVVMENQTFQLKVETNNGLNPYSLYNKKNHIILANDDYYSIFGHPQKVEVIHKLLSNNRREITFAGFTDDLQVAHTFVFPEPEDWFDEYLSGFIYRTW